MSKTIQNIMSKLPKRLEVGKIYCGPDFYGCINTGSQPAILKSRRLNDHPALNKGYRFVVGPQLEIQDACFKLLTNQTTHQSKHQKISKDGKIMEKWTCYFYKNAAAAKQRFKKLCEKRLKENEKARQENEKANQQVKSKDPTEVMSGILKLNDF